MKLNYNKVNRSQAEVLQANGVAAVVLPEENGFRKLIAYFLMDRGEYAWIHSAFRFVPKKKKGRQGNKPS